MNTELIARIADLLDESPEAETFIVERSDLEALVSLAGSCSNPWADKVGNPAPLDFCNPWSDKADIDWGDEGEDA